MVAEDADAAAGLSAELGYQVDPASMRERIEARTSLPSHALFVACLDGAVVGWIDAGIVHHLQSGSYGEIGGLVVASNVRGKGIGHLLVAQAELWIAAQRSSTVLVRSQIAREAAHRFYLREGFTRTKTSAVFSKTL